MDEDDSAGAPGSQDAAEGEGVHVGPRLWPDAWARLPAGWAQLELLQQVGEDEEELLARQRLAQAAALAHHERDL